MPALHSIPCAGVCYGSLCVPEKAKGEDERQQQAGEQGPEGRGEARGSFPNLGNDTGRSTGASLNSHGHHRHVGPDSRQLQDERQKVRITTGIMIYEKCVFNQATT